MSFNLCQWRELSSCQRFLRRSLISLPFPFINSSILCTISIYIAVSLISSSLTHSQALFLIPLLLIYFTSFNFLSSSFLLLFTFCVLNGHSWGIQLISSSLLLIYFLSSTALLLKNPFASSDINDSTIPALKAQSTCLVIFDVFNKPICHFSLKTVFFFGT